MNQEIYILLLIVLSFLAWMSIKSLFVVRFALAPAATIDLLVVLLKLYWWVFPPLQLVLHYGNDGRLYLRYDPSTKLITILSAQNLENGASGVYIWTTNLKDLHIIRAFYEAKYAHFALQDFISKRHANLLLKRVKNVGVGMHQISWRPYRPAINQPRRET